MGIIAWIVLGLVAGLIANMLIPGRRQQGPDFFVHGNDAGQTPRTERGDDSGGGFSSPLRSAQA